MTKKLLLLLLVFPVILGCSASPLKTYQSAQCVITGISEDDVVRAQKEWADAIVAIGN